MAQIQLGDTIRLHYSSQLEDGTQVMTTEGKEPIEIQTGKGMFFPLLEQEIFGMEIGDVKTTTLTPEEAFGVYRRELVTQINREEFSSRGIEPHQGLTLEIPIEGDRTVQARVTAITDQSVQLDANHPLAGHSITVSFQIVSIV